MVHGNLANGDYFIDVSSISQSTLRAIFGVWVNICVAVIAFCLRSSYRSSVVKQVSSHNPQQSPVSLWRVSPPVIPSEVFQQRLVLLRCLAQGKFTYVLASLACVVAAVGVVPGILVTREHNTLQGNVVRMTALVQALERAGAPHDQLFDFIPQQQLHWLFDTNQWNNSWMGNCTFQVYPAVDLTLLPSASENYQDEVPGLASCLPEWATQDPSKQGTHYAGFYENVGITNSTGNWRDLLVTYSFGSAPSDGVRNMSTVNIAFVNFLAHNVGRSLTGQFLQTSLKSDVNVASCTLDNATPGVTDQAKADGGNYGNVVQNVGNMYLDYVLATSTAGGQVIQPTGEQMVRYYQAFMATKDSTNVHPVQRTLSVSQPTVQIRLSALIATIVPFLAALVFSGLAHFTEPRDSKRKRFKLPGSQFDWIVQAAREYFRGDETIIASSSSTYAQQRGDLAFGFVERSGHGRAIGQIQAVPVYAYEALPELRSGGEKDSIPGPPQ